MQKILPRIRKVTSPQVSCSTASGSANAQLRNSSAATAMGCVPSGLGSPGRVAVAAFVFPAGAARAGCVARRLAAGRVHHAVTEVGLGAGGGHRGTGTRLTVDGWCRVLQPRRTVRALQPFGERRHPVAPGGLTADLPAIGTGAVAVGGAIRHVRNRSPGLL